MFTTSCFVRENSRFLCNELEKIGYAPSIEYEGDLTYLIVDYDDNIGAYYTEANEGAPLLYTRQKRIDCGYNTELFLAISSLRDDSNKHQWYTDETRWCLHNLEPKYDWMIDDSWHKATVEELIEHFNNKKDVE